MTATAQNSAHFPVILYLPLLSLLPDSFVALVLIQLSIIFYHFITFWEFLSIAAHKIGQRQSKKTEQMTRGDKGTHTAANVGGADGKRNEKKKKREIEGENKIAREAQIDGCVGGRSSNGCVSWIGRQLIISRPRSPVSLHYNQILSGGQFATHGLTKLDLLSQSARGLQLISLSCALC